MLCNAAKKKFPSTPRVHTVSVCFFLCFFLLVKWPRSSGLSSQTGSCISFYRLRQKEGAGSTVSVRVVRQHSVLRCGITLGFDFQQFTAVPDDFFLSSFQKELTLPKVFCLLPWKPQSPSIFFNCLSLLYPCETFCLSGDQNKRWLSRRVNTVRWRSFK